MKKYYLIAICSFLIFYSCQKLPEVTHPQFEVSVEKNTYKVGDTVRFAFNGNPDIISFYSGELGNDYQFRDGRIAEPDYQIHFETQCLDGEQAGQMHVLVSTNFDGNYTIEGVQNPNVAWTDITSQFKMAPTGNIDRTYNASGWKSIATALQSQSDTTDVYLAVKQTVKNQNEFGLGNLNRLRYLTVRSVYLSLITTLYLHPELEWKLFSTPNKVAGRASLQDANTIMMRNNWAPAESRAYDTEDWAVSKLVKLPKRLDFGPDKAIGIKGVTDISIDNYSYVYTAPGNYTVVFKAINANIGSRLESVKTVNLTIE